jgi:methyl-accepting chemotaxis protein
MKQSKNIKLKSLLEEFDTQQKSTQTEKAAFLEEVKQFTAYESVIYRTEDLKKVAESISNIAQKAENIMLQETDEWFDEITVKRNMKQLRENVKQFNQSVHEVSKLQQRLEALYEEIGGTLNRYYEL